MKSKIKLRPDQQFEVDTAKLFNAWWEREGRYYDPDIEDMDWYDKRRELAAVAFAAGRKPLA